MTERPLYVNLTGAQIDHIRILEEGQAIDLTAGGTSAITAAGARTNLGVYSTEEINSTSGDIVDIITGASGLIQEDIIHLEARDDRGAGLGLLGNHNIAFPMSLDRRPIVLIAQSSPDPSSGCWWAGYTTGAPSNGLPFFEDRGDTNDQTEYGDGIQSGELWPYQVPGEQVKAGGPGCFPACYQRTDVNHYRAGCLIPAEKFRNGAVIDIILAGDYYQHANSDDGIGRMIEFIIEPEVDPTATFNDTTAAAFQTDALTSVNKNSLFEVVIRGTCLASTVDYDTDIETYYQLWQMKFSMAPNDGVTACTHCYTKMKRVTYTSETVDWTSGDVQLGVRYKCDTYGNTLGSTAAYPLGDTIGPQVFASGCMRTSSYMVVLYPSTH